MSTGRPRIVVFTTVFPSSGSPQSGLFIRERMFRVGQQIPVTVVAPVPWFPFQTLIRWFRPHFRPSTPKFEVQDGFEVYHPRFLSVPGLLKSLDGVLLALCCWLPMRRVRDRFQFDLIDAHFAYPDGYAATLLGRWFGVPVTITVRGTEVPLAKTWLRRRLMVKALQRATRVFAVAEALKRHVCSLGLALSKVQVVQNGVDTGKFFPVEKAGAREAIAIDPSAPLLITVGGLVERKGFHRVIEVLPDLRRRFPTLSYLIVGGPGAEGDFSERLKRQIESLELQGAVHFIKPVPPDQLRFLLSAADVFVLATRNEGWANVLLEAMACGLPVVATDVGGNREVVSGAGLGRVVAFGDSKALASAIEEALSLDWNHEDIIRYAHANAWDTRVGQLLEAFDQLATGAAACEHGARVTR